MSFLPQFLKSKKKEGISYSAVAVSSTHNGSDTNLPRQLQPSQVPGWPTAPERVENMLLWVLADILLIMLPIAFIILAILAYKLEGKETSKYGDDIKQAILLGPTVFPLAFAALGGRSLKKIALWRAEKGASLGFLEHMIGSQSLVAALSHAITLRSADFLTLSLLVLWALSPLGGQSALRLLHETNSTVSETRPVFYANVDAPSSFVMKQYNNYNEDAVEFVTAVVWTTFSTLDTIDLLSVDPWNHPKIPRIFELEEAEARNATDTPWFTVDKSKNVTYASLTGVNVMNLQRNTHANFTVPYEYLYFNCDLVDTGVNQTELDARKFLSNLNIVPPWDDETSESLYNTTIHIANLPSAYFIGHYKLLGYNAEDDTPKTLFFLGKDYKLAAPLYSCSYNSVLVEANIQCRSDSCEVDRVRRLRTPRSERGAPGLPWDVVHSGHWNKHFLTHLMGIGGLVSPFRNHPVSTYVYGSIPWRLAYEDAPPAELDWSTVPLVDISNRLTRYLNMYWDASRWMVAVTRNDPYAESPSTLNKTTGEPFIPLTMNKTEALMTWEVAVYKRNAGWIACLIICSSVLLAVGVLSLVLSFHITAPDVFDYVSSFTRDNPYVDAPGGGSALCGADRARLLKNMRVQIGDVDADKEVGYIALRSVVNKKDCVEGRVRPEKMYR